VTLTLSKVKVKVTGLLNFRQLAKPCMLAAMTAAPLRGFLVMLVLSHSGYRKKFFFLLTCIIIALTNLGSDNEKFQINAKNVFVYFYFQYSLPDSASTPVVHFFFVVKIEQGFH